MKLKIALFVIMGILIGVISIQTISISHKIEEKTKTIESQEIGEKIQKSENELIEETTKEKINFLENVKDPVYKKNKKNIKIPIIIYHAFETPEPSNDTYQLFSTQARFEENVTTLLNDGYTFITLEDLYKYNKGEVALPEKVCIITMDDGWLGCYTEAYPVLQKYHVPATIFIVSNLIETGGYFSWEQAKEMYDSGLVKLHTHGKSHIEYSSVSKEKLVSDFTTAHEELEEKMGEKIQKIMAYPSRKCLENSKNG